MDNTCVCDCSNNDNSHNEGQQIVNTINLTQGLTDNEEYKAFKFPGGEIHFIFKNQIKSETITINTRLNTSDDIMLLILVVETLRKDYGNELIIKVFIPYMPYQQADRNFAVGECFSLQTMTKLLNSLDVDRYYVFDPHSDVTPALLKKCIVKDNSDFIAMGIMNKTFINVDNLVWLSPDAGAYKKIGKLSFKIKFTGDIAAANKYRSTSSGNIESLELSVNDFGGKDILIIDDICMGGRTFIELAKKLQTRNVGRLYLAVSHMINQRPNEELSKYFTTIFTTNSRHDLYNSSNIQTYNIF